ncbi:MAG: hypothetical protein JJU37_06425 [Balneolaceae bacterium]|nr:hypothetical protein [Balneolaceae bacterium]
MKILMGIIFFHMLILYRAKFSIDGGIPILSTFFLTVLLVIYVVIMMFIMPVPES